MLRWIQAALVFGGLVACTGDDDPTMGMDTGMDTEPPDTGEPPPPMPMNIVETAQGNADLSTLVDLLGQADLADTLADNGPFTVFAPTNAAFANFDASGLSETELAELLTYHVVSGTVDSSSIPDLAESVATYTLFFDTSNGVRVNDATVSEADIEATNGIIHIIDTVLEPPTIVDAAGFAGLGELVAAVNAADPAVAATLSSPGTYTVFAPTDGAFQGITAPSDPEELAEVLLYHTLGFEVDSASIPGLATTAAGFTVFFDTESGVVVNDATVQVADVRTTNGIVHVIDGVLTPPNILEAAGFAGLNELAAAVQAADESVLKTLASPGPFTVFAPTDAAFQNITAPKDPDALAEVLFYHALTEEVDSTTIPDLADSAAGFTLFFDTSTKTVGVNDANVQVADVRTTNGIVHVIDTVLIPPTIVDAAGFAGLNELVTAVLAADASVFDTLSGPGEFTVFAPTDAAFQAIAAPTDPDELAEVLFYHALTQEVDSGQIPALADSAAGFTLFFDTTSGVVVNDATVQIADVRTTNGIVHVIDDVLLPPDILDAAGFAGLNELAAAVTAAPKVANTLSTDGPFTVFAPTDAAFQNITVPTDVAQLTEILFYHALTEEVDSTAIPGLADSAAGFTLFFDTTSGVVVNDAAVQIADVRTTNGIVHVIDTVLLPPDILGAAGFAGLNELAAAVGAADPVVATALSAPGPFTVFAPTDAAFQSIIAPSDPGELADVLLYHAYGGAIPAAAIPDKADSALLNDFGIPVSALFSTDGGVSINGATVQIADVRTTNGIVHVIDDVLLPPNIIDLAGIAGLNAAAGALVAAPGNLDDLLSGPGPFTVFVPTDAAFAVAPAVTGQDLADVLLFHVVDTSQPAPVLAAGLNDGELDMALTATNPGDTVTVDTLAGTVENANLVLTDVNGTNGTVHVIDAVMIPPSFP